MAKLNKYGVIEDKEDIGISEGTGTLVSHRYYSSKQLDYFME